MALSAETTELIKATAPVLKEHGLAISKRLYENLFDNHPYVNEFLNRSHVFSQNGEVAPQVRLFHILY